jgi:polygalacturonase
MSLNFRRSPAWCLALAGALSACTGPAGEMANRTGESQGPLARRPAEPTGATQNAARRFNVKELGAVGDGTTKDTAALQKALDQCAEAGGGTVVVPAGNYLTGSLKLGGHTTLRLEKDATLVGSPDKADYPVMKVRWEGEWRDGHSSLLRAENVTDVAIVGEGTVQGPPLALAALRPNARGDVRGPSIFEPIEVKNLTLEGITSKYQRMWSIHMTYCENVVVRNVTVRSAQSNGDGIDVDSCKHVLIEKCDIDGGDDAVCLKSGRGMEAVTIGRPTEDVIVRGCTLASSGFAGFGIGTEMSGGVRNVLVTDCTFARCRQNGIFIKSKTNRGGFIENITIENCRFTNQSATFFSIDLVTKGIEATKPVTGDDKWPRAKNIVFRNNTVDGVGDLVVAKNIAAERPVDGLVISGLKGTAVRGMVLTNMVNVKLQNIKVAGPSPLLTISNVKGEGLAGAATAPAGR